MTNSRPLVQPSVPDGLGLGTSETPALDSFSPCFINYFSQALEPLSPPPDASLLSYCRESVPLPSSQVLGPDIVSLATTKETEHRQSNVSLTLSSG